MSESKIKYHPNPLTAFENGAMMDLRMRLAVEFVKAGALHGPTPKELAANALAVAGELFEQGEALGWVEGMPDDDGHLNVGIRDHIKRNVKAQLYQNEVPMREQQNQAPHVQIPRPAFQQ